jgi:hypothetical protein
MSIRNPSGESKQNIILNINHSTYSRCPFCDSDCGLDTEDYDLGEIEHRKYKIKVSCNSCGTEYIETGELKCTDYEIIKANKEQFEKYRKDFERAWSLL